MRPTQTIQLPQERARQLKAVADARGLSLNDLLESIVAEAVAAGTIADATPGFDIAPLLSARTPAVRFLVLADTTPGFGFPKIRAEHARLVAEALEGVAEGGKAKAVQSSHGGALNVARIGRGVSLWQTDAKGETVGKRSITPGLARDLARQLRRAADQAEGNA